MGSNLFNRKKGKDDDGEEKRPESRQVSRSQKLIAPGGNKPAQPATGAQARTGTGSGTARPATAAPGADQAQPGAARSTQVVRPSGPLAPAAPQQGQRPQTGAVRPGGQPPAARTPTPANDMPAMPTKPRSSGNDVLDIDVGASGPGKGAGRQAVGLADELSFSGDLASGKAGAGPVRTGDAKLVEFLVGKASLLNSAQAEQAQMKAKSESLPLDVACVKLGYITEDQMVNALTQECWVPHLKVDKYEIRKKALDTISHDDAVRFGVLPVDKLGSILNLAMVNPLDAETIRVIETKTGLDVKKVVATRSEIEAGIAKYYGAGGAPAPTAKEGGLEILQDQEPKRVTQMLEKVQAPPPAARPAAPAAPAAKAPAPAPAAAPARPAAAPAAKAPAAPAAKAPAPAAPAAKAPAPAPAAAPAPSVISIDNIEDIDDLLGDSEPVKPSVLEPITISPDELETVDEGDPLLADDEPVITSQVNRPAAMPVPAAKAPAPTAGGRRETADLDDLDEFLVSSPAEKAGLEEALAPKISRPAPAPAPAVAPAAKAQAPAAKAPAPAAAPAAKAPAPSAPAAPAPAPVPAAAKPSAKAGKPQVVSLVAVLEEEFQHAITHGKSHVFEKWVAIQTRNRILNAIPVESELDAVMGSAYKHGYAVPVNV